jgi:hypothetical protein
LTPNRGHLLDNTAGFEVSHRFHGLSCHIEQAKEVNFHLLPNLLF